jgi:hypothetical protein
MASANSLQNLSLVGTDGSANATSVQANEDVYSVSVLVTRKAHATENFSTSQ